MIENKIIQGDCIEELKKLPENSVDSIVTDSPYGLEFMGKEWDKFKKGENIAGGTVTDKTKIFGRLCGKAPSFYQIKDWSSYQQFVYQWSTECLRVLKPGGFLLSFGGTRTYHRMTCAIEDAGFEIRDCIMWIYASGFPKSLNIGKAVDKLQGNEREYIGENPNAIGRKENVGKFQPVENVSGGQPRKSELTKGTSEWEGWGTALKPAVEPIVVARKPLSEKSVAENVLKWGTGGLNIDATRIPTEDGKPHYGQLYRKSNQIYGGGKGTNTGACLPANLQGRFPANLILECICDEVIEGKQKICCSVKQSDGKEGMFGLGSRSPKMIDGKSIIHTNPECPCYILDQQSGIIKGEIGRVNRTPKDGKVGLFGLKSIVTEFGSKDIGGASRYFYVAKASQAERQKGCEDLYILKDGTPEEIKKEIEKILDNH